MWFQPRLFVPNCKETFLSSFLLVVMTSFATLRFPLTNCQGSHFRLSFLGQLLKEVRENKDRVFQCPRVNCQKLMLIQICKQTLSLSSHQFRPFKISNQKWGWYSFQYYMSVNNKKRLIVILLKRYLWMICALAIKKNFDARPAIYIHIHNAKKFSVDCSFYCFSFKSCKIIL